MPYQLSSDQFSHAFLKPILTDLSTLFEKAEIRFFVIGAIARDLVMGVHQESAGRLTYDLDIAIAIENWSQFEEVAALLISTEKFSNEPKQRQRFYYEEEYILDVVPFGAIMKQSDKIFWPPDEVFAMTVLGFSEVHENSLEVIIDEALTIQVASLAGIFILKLIAWKDRYLKTKKDAEDIGFILNNYLGIHEDRATKYYEDIYNDQFSVVRGSGILLGKDISEILPLESKARTAMVEQLENQLEQKVESVLLNQIIETNKSFHFDDLWNSLKMVVAELKRNDNRS